MKLYLVSIVIYFTFREKSLSLSRERGRKREMQVNYNVGVSRQPRDIPAERGESVSQSWRKLSISGASSLKRRASA